MTLDEKLQITASGVQGQTREKFGSIEKLCQNAPLEGSIIEVGVWRGGIARHLADIFPGRKIFLADTFTGIPYVSKYDNHYRVGSFSDVDIEQVRSIFPEENAEILQGIFPGEFQGRLDGERFGVVHLDVDVYQGYRDSLEFLYPRTVSGGLVMLDDYKCPLTEGATIAVDEFLSDKPENVLFLNYQFYFIKEG